MVREGMAWVFDRYARPDSPLYELQRQAQGGSPRALGAIRSRLRAVGVEKPAAAEAARRLKPVRWLREIQIVISRNRGGLVCFARLVKDFDVAIGHEFVECLY